MPNLGVGGLRGVTEFHLRVEELEEAVDIAAVPQLVTRPDKLNVLLGHQPQYPGAPFN